MESLRRSFKNKLIIEYKSKNLTIERHNQSIKNIKSSDMNTEFIINQIDQLKNTISVYKLRVEEIHITLTNIDVGDYDDQINQEQKEAELKHQELEEQQIFKRTVRREEKVRAKESSDERWKDIKIGNKEQSQKRRDMKYGLKCYWKAIDSLPEYMKKNLKDMPCNKGYVWRGAHFYGLRKAERGAPHIMFELVKGSQLITETTDKEIKVYQRKGKGGKKTLVSRKPRRQFEMGFLNLGDCVKT